MTCKAGDKVRFLNSTGNGTITRIEGRTVFVEDEDGFEIPYLTSDIVVVNDVKEATNFPAHTTAFQSKDAPVEISKEQVTQQESDKQVVTYDEQGEDYEILIAFLPPQNEKTQLYFLNDSTYQVYYSIGFGARTSKVAPLASGHLEADSKGLVKTLFLSELRDVKTLRVEVMLFKNIEHAPVSVDPVYLELNPIKFFKVGAFKENDFFEDNALIYSLISNKEDSTKKAREAIDSISPEEIQEAMMSKNDVPSAAKPNHRKLQSEIEEVDLHAEVLIPNHEGMGAGEIFERQMAKFIAVLENALESGQRGRIVFIHGIGSGKLKQELCNVLTRSYKELHFQDASYKEYGYGATMVFL
ncbi:MAG: DUF2027 domain-containing protein [Prevotellaceae bacterium]|jgi:ribosomal protein L22|nr:DUF2027 domain-containing protein [Prevotellaceae bacterium]